MTQDPDGGVAEVANVPVGLRHSERGQVEVWPVRFWHARVASVGDEERLARHLAPGIHSPFVSDGLLLLTPPLFELQLGVIACRSTGRDAGDLPVLEQLLDHHHLRERWDVVAVVDT